jgi:hypothetical protein
MIAGRPTNLWLGLTTAISGAVAVTLISLGFDAAIVGTLAGAWSGVLGAAILLIANQPPTMQAGDTFKIQQPAGTPNTTGVVTPPEPVSVSSVAPEPVTPLPTDGEG